MQLHTEFSIGYSDFMTFFVNVFARKCQGISASSSSLMTVEFVNSFKNFKGNKYNAERSEIELIKEDCKGKMAYFAER